MFFSHFFCFYVKLHCSYFFRLYYIVFILFNYDSPSSEVLSNGQFLEIDEVELNNINKGMHRANRHVELWVKYVFNELRKFQGYDIQKFIENLSKSEHIVVGLVGMLSLFNFQETKKMVIYTFLSSKTFSLLFFSF
jgi:hypothetical protein